MAQKNAVRLSPGDSVTIIVHHDPQYGGQKSTYYSVMTPTWGQDDGTAGNLFIECVKNPDGDPDAIITIAGDDAEHLDFGDPTEVVSVSGTVIRLAYQSF